VDLLGTYIISLVLFFRKPGVTCLLSCLSVSRRKKKLSATLLYHGSRAAPSAGRRCILLHEYVQLYGGHAPEKSHEPLGLESAPAPGDHVHGAHASAVFSGHGVVLPQFSFTRHRPITVSILTTRFFLQKIFLDTSSFYIYNSSINILD
jgi:hypothetical protein